MKLIEKLFSVLTKVVLASIIVPLVLALIISLGHDTGAFVYVMIYAAGIGVVNLIILQILKKWTRGISR